MSGEVFLGGGRGGEEERKRRDGRENLQHFQLLLLLLLFSIKCCFRWMHHHGKGLPHPFFFARLDLPSSSSLLPLFSYSLKDVIKVKFVQIFHVVVDSSSSCPLSPSSPEEQNVTDNGKTPQRSS